MAVMLPSQSLGSGCRGPTSEANGFDTKPYFSQQLPPNFDNDYPRSFLRRYTAEMDNPLIHQQPTEQTSLPTLFKQEHGQYARSIWDHSKRSAKTSLYSGQAYQNLAFYHFNTKRDGNLQEKVPSGFASYYSVLPDRPVTFCDVSDYSFLQSIPEVIETSTQSGHVFILRGHPPADFLRLFGATFGIDPEFFRRHTDYLTTSDIQSHFVDPALPSCGDNILQIRLTTIGSRRSSTHHGHNWKQVEKLRAAGTANMQDYLSNLRKGKDWKPGNSIVRDFTVHDEDLFSIDQTATIYTKFISQANGNDHWLVTIWLDCGQDLGISPRGPWKHPHHALHAHLIPVFRHTPLSPLYATTTQTQETFQYPQAAVNLYRPSCSLVKSDLAISFPLSAVFEVLLFSAASESQFLNMINSNLRLTRKMLGSDENSIVAARNNLVNSLYSLQEHMKDYHEIMAFIRRQMERSSATEPFNANHRSAVLQILADFERLVSRSELLCKECTRNISIAMNNASIAEAKRGIEQSQRLFKFTVLASVYVPLSFTASFFGMNFKEIGQGRLSIWLYFVVSLPIFAFSALTLFLDKSAIQRFFSRYSRSEHKRLSGFVA